MMNGKQQWKRVSIKDICISIIDCVNKTAPTVEYPTDFKMIRTTNVKKGWVDLSECKYVTKETFERWTKRAIPQRGDVILTREAPLGEVGMLRSHGNVFLGQRLVQYRANPQLLDNRFLLYAFQERDLQSQIRALGSGSTVEHMRVPDAEKLTLLLPPLSTQRKIASILSAYDDLIENNTRRIAILEEMAQSLYQEWFVHYRFRGNKNNSMVESELGMIPEGWEVKRMKEIISYHIGGGWGQDKESEQYPYEAYVIRGTDIPGARHMVTDNCPLRYHKGSNLKSRKLQYKDIVFEVSGGSKGQPVGRALFVSPQILKSFRENVICASFCKLLRISEKIILPELVYLHLLNIYKSGQIEKYQVQSTGITNFKFEYFLNDEILVVPDMHFQTRFKEIIEPIFSSIQDLGAKNSNLRYTRDLLLPKLISGEIDVEQFVDRDVIEENAEQLVAVVK